MITLIGVRNALRRLVGIIIFIVVVIFVVVIFVVVDVIIIVAAVAGLSITIFRLVIVITVVVFLVVRNICNTERANCQSQIGRRTTSVEATLNRVSERNKPILKNIAHQACYA